MQDILSAQNSDCSLIVTASWPNPALLRLHYEFKNNTLGVVYLPNMLYEPIDNLKNNFEVFQVAPNLAHILSEKTEVNITKAVENLSSNDGIIALSIPCMTRLESGQKVEEALELALPLTPTNKSYLAAVNHSTSLLPMQFKLGYFISSPFLENSISEVKTTAGMAYYIEPYAAGEQRILTVGPFKKLISVNNSGNTPMPASQDTWTPWG